ncbi:YtxH domain-containing protein [Nocardioides gansuensis]|uniref:YtxH domain-containing protein n=1 Tax=Nocardioides gansuensis TaxID=2138300 RepID=UPI0010577248|nr:YtxH domain-containing protein [Nocardioides gansuensis]
MKKLLALAAGAVGYVLGSRAGRERYEQLKRAAEKVKDDPRVQEKAHQAVDLAKEKAPPAMKERLTSSGTSSSGMSASSATSAPPTSGPAASASGAEPPPTRPSTTPPGP